MSMNNTIHWINNEIMRNTVYHNHKENMAWVATALYISGALTLGWHLKDIVNCSEKVVASLVALAVTGLAVWFVCWQFGKRNIAARRVKGLIQTAIDLCKKDYPRLRWCVEKGYLYPIFINENIEAEQPQKDDQGTSKTISLLAMGIAFTVFLILILC